MYFVAVFDIEAELSIFNKYFLNCKAYNINNIKGLSSP